MLNLHWIVMYLIKNEYSLQELEFYMSVCHPVFALREVWETETPQNCSGTSKNQCQEVWDSQLLKTFSHRTKIKNEFMCYLA